MHRGSSCLCYILGAGIIPFLANTYENVALRKSTWQLHPIPNFKASSGCAVDGRKSNLSFAGGECTASLYSKTTAEWRVDLGKVLSIHHIFIQYATENQKWDEFNLYTSHFLGYSVYISNTTKKQDGVLCFKDTIYTRATIPNPVNITCPQHGRYVIYYNNRTHKPSPYGYSLYAYSDLCEVEVYGCQHQRRYGENCLLSCPENCRGGVCHIVHGTCFECVDGYIGTMCDRALQKGITGNHFVIIITLTTAAVIIAIIIIGALYKRRQMLIRKYGDNSAHVQNFEMEVDVLTSNSQESSAILNVNVSDRRVLPVNMQQGTIQENGCQSIQEEMSERLEHNEDSHSFRASIEHTFGVNEYQVKFTSDIQMHELQTFIGVNGDGFKGEFALLPVGEHHACYEGKRGENLSKNRYKTILPYDHSRVILKTDTENNDYINANYIKDNSGTIAYIATQGPKNNTINDFWRMVWQENVTIIVMLTNLIEGEKTKCNQYWPESTKAEFYGHITVNKYEEIHFAFYIIRNFTIWESEESRFVTQYHYTKWPDHGTPDPLSLVVFHSRVVRTRSDEHKAPTIVHCSAGIGRTGTYIAFDTMCKEGKSKGTLNVASYVKVMRSCRINMVQTYEQYKTIYLALNEEFKASVDTRSVSAYRESMKHFFGEEAFDQVIFQKEFKILSDIKSGHTEGYLRAATLHTVNTEEEMLQLDEYNLYLTPTVSYRRSFINAIYVSSFRDENAFIVTQYPSQHDAVDFLRMLVDNDSDTIICMDPLAETESSPTWLQVPSSCTMFGPFTLQHEGDSEVDVKVTNVKILDGEGLTHPLKIVQPIGPLKSVQDTACLRSLVSYVMHIQTENPITLVSKDGISLCGIFCAVCNCIQQINMDDSVDVFTTVRQLQTRIPEFCFTLDEYILVYKSVRDFIEFTSEHVYSNQ